nr:MAG TPA: hypothetical protein [Caudoviricetes sp.]
MQYDEEKHSNFPWLLPKASEKQRLDRDNGNPWGKGLPGQRHQRQTRGGGIYNTP